MTFPLAKNPYNGTSPRRTKTAVLGSIICGIIMALYAFVPAVLGLVALAEFPNIEANNAVATVALNPHASNYDWLRYGRCRIGDAFIRRRRPIRRRYCIYQGYCRTSFGKASLMLSSLNIAVYACYSSASSPSLSPL